MVVGFGFRAWGMAVVPSVVSGGRRSPGGWFQFSVRGWGGVQVGMGSANRRAKIVWMWVLQGQSGGKFSQRRRPPRVRVAGVWKTWNCRVRGSARARCPSQPSSLSQAIRSQAMAWMWYQAALTANFLEGSRLAPVSLPQGPCVASGLRSRA